MEEQVAFFKPYPFKIGEKIRIEDSRRAGDWEVVDVTDTKVTLRCPISRKSYQWNRFCYHIETKSAQWPGD